MIAANKVVSVHYTLTENDQNGQVIESTEGGAPLAFIYGIGSMIADFEKNLVGLKTGDAFAFGIKAENAYGAYDERMLVEIPKHHFEHEGKIPDGLLEVGNVLPFSDPEGHQMEGMVSNVGLEAVQIDFNHPMAGVDLFFIGSVAEVRDADPSELAHGHVHGDDGHHH